MIDEKIRESSVNVKLLQAKERFERETRVPVNHPQYRAFCYDCDWRWKSDADPENPAHARSRARAHSQIERHHSESVFDVLAQHDMTFVPRDGVQQR